MFDDCYLRLGKGRFANCTPLTPALLASLYALPEQADVMLRPVLEAIGDGQPWSESFAIAPEQTTAAVAAMLRQVMLATSDLDPARISTSNLPDGSRAKTHLNALIALWREHPEAIPSDISRLGSLLAYGAGEALQPLALVLRGDDPRHSALERAVLRHLASQHNVVAPEDADYQRLIANRLAAAAPAETLLGHVQRHALDPSATRHPRDDSIAVLSIRDSLCEAEAGAAIIQHWLRADPTLKPSDVAVILPRSGEYALALGETFARAGLCVSSVPGQAMRRNVGGEAVLHFLQCRRRPAPAMALASLYCSPILCWPPYVGNELARRVMQGDFEPHAAREMSGKSARLFSLIRSPSSSTNGQLKEHLRLFRALLCEDKALEADVLEAKAQIARLSAAIGTAPDSAAPEWDQLIQFAAAYHPIQPERGAYYLGGIGVLHAQEQPGRRYRKLVMLGFNDGCYPASPSGNPFFLDSEVALIAEKTGLKLPSQASHLDTGLATFTRQLSAASEQTILLMSERDRLGAALSPSSSLPLVARLVEGCDDPDTLVVPLSRGEGTIWDSLIDWRPKPEYKSAEALDIPANFELGTNLLALRQKEDGTPRPQSPSRLENLLVSPLAWVLGELGAKHVPWAPEALNVMLRGSLAHEVFERLFVPGSDHPDDAIIAARVPALLADRIRALAPFLQGAAWTVERLALESEITASAKHWSRVLHSLGAEIVGNEFWLAGNLLGHPVHGKADCLLRLPDGQPVVVDYKKSSSGTRRQRLNKGYDLQVDLYRRMDVRVSEKSSEGILCIAETLTAWNGLPAVAYHTLNDGAVLINGANGIDDDHVEVIEGDIAQNAITLVKTRFEALKVGRIDLNTTADAKYFQREAALGTYALDDSPLVSAFMRDVDAPSVDL